jgi:hypothetical protein
MMKWLSIIFILLLCSCVPGETPPSERGGDSTTFIPPPPPEETDAPIPPPRVSYDPAGNTNIESVSNDPNVFQYDPGSYSYTITGSISIETATIDSDGHFTYDDTKLVPLASAKIQLWDAQSDSMVSETFVENGTYNFLVDQRRIVYLRLIAESDNPKVRVANNTNNNETYYYETEYFDLINNPIKNFVINIGFNGSLYYANSHENDSSPGDSDFFGGSIADSFSAPFGILNNYHAMITQLHSDIVSSGRKSDSQLASKELNVFWSPINKASLGYINDGEIGKAHYNPIYPGIFLKGEVDVDADEWDNFLQAKLLAYHFLTNYSRSEIYTLEADETKTLQPTQHFAHIFAQIFASHYVVSLPAGKYVESTGVNGQTLAKEIDFNNNLITNREWYSFEGGRKFFYDLFDTVNEGIDYDSLTAIDLMETMLDPDFIQDDDPITMYKLIHHLKENNLSDSIFIDNLSQYYSYKGHLWGPRGPQTTDNDLPISYVNNNPLIPISFVPVQTAVGGAFTNVTVAKNNGECGNIGSQVYLKFIPISIDTIVQFTKTDLMTVEILRNGQIIWSSVNDDDETFLLRTRDFTPTQFINSNSPYYVIRARSHPDALANNATLGVKLHTEYVGAPTDNINNQFSVYSIGTDTTRSFRVGTYDNICHMHPIASKHRFRSIPSNNVRINLKFPSNDPIKYKILIDGEVVVDSNTNGRTSFSEILYFNDDPASVNTDRYMEIQVTSDYNLFREFDVEFDLEYLAF